MLGDGAACMRMAGFVGLAVCGQVLRNWLMLQASGIHASIFDATAVLIAVAVLRVLPVGPSVGAAAAVLILGAEGVAGVSAAGVMLTATGTAGALAYAAWAYADRRWRRPLRTPAAGRRRAVIVAGRSAEPKWLGLGVVLEALSLGGYVALFRTVFSCHGARIGWKASYQITMAGVVATKLFAAAGAGGVALTV